jgi:hypothetical protein
MSQDPQLLDTTQQQPKFNLKLLALMFFLLGVFLQPAVLFVLRATNDGFGKSIEMMDYSPEATLHTLNENQAQVITESLHQAVSEYDVHYDKVPTWAKPVVWTTSLLILLVLNWRRRRRRRSA